MAKYTFYNYLGIYNSKYKKAPIDEDKFNLFIESLNELFDRLDTIKENDEEGIKNAFQIGILNKFYRFTSPLGKIDLAILKNNKTHVIFEFKSMTNKSEMVQIDNLNKKALHEAIKYYYKQPSLEDRLRIKNIVITDTKQLYFIKADSFDNKYFKKLFEDFSEEKSENIYSLIERKITDFNISFDYAVFDLDKYKSNIRLNKLTEEDRKHLIYLYKALHPDFLLKEFYPKDVNVLNKGFYSELLYIMGLKEVKENKKLTITRNKDVKNTLLDIVYKKLKEEKDIADEDREDCALELVVTWINRILFIKLFESQLVAFNSENADYKILNYDKIDSFSKLNALFMQVLNKRIENRESEYQKYSYIPYLNSSLFELTDTEINCFPISSIENKRLQLKSNSSKKFIKNKEHIPPTLLEYLLDFLGYYNFSAYKQDDLLKQGKDIINASVLGLIFEKINGHKEGAIYTPSRITEYMARNCIQKTFIQKFNKAYNKKLDNLNDVKFVIQSEFNNIEKRKEVSELINSIRICDPAVGSGHFLVSLLNQILVLKSELGCIFKNNSSDLLVEYGIKVENDTLMLVNGEGKLFEYDKTNKLSQEIQQTLFSEKKTIIENCLFGVDINATSVHICRLRLWIELLKNAYYKSDGTMETLPNIDINIKCGNSLISKIPFEINRNKLTEVDNAIVELIDEYKKVVKDYKQTSDKEIKKKLNKKIDEIQKTIEGKYAKQLSLNFGEEYFNSTNENTVYENAIFKDSMEWAIQFPEILNNGGAFLGFDLVIGNPPYVFTRNQKYKKGFKKYYQDYLIKNNIIKKQKGNNIQSGKLNLYTWFIIRSIELLKENNVMSFIIPNGFLRTTTYDLIRKFVLENTEILEIVDLGTDVFENVTTTAIIITVRKNKKTRKTHSIEVLSNIKNLVNEDYDINYINQFTFLENQSYAYNIFVDDKKQLLNQIIETETDELGAICCSISPGIDGNKNKYVKNTQDDNSYKPLLFGKNIGKYSIKFKNNYIKYDRKLLNRARDERLFLSPKIVIQRVSGGIYPITACVDEKQYYTFNSINNIILKDNCGYDLYYILTLLNSKLINWYYANNFSNNSNQTVNITKTYLEKIPIKVASEKQQKSLSEKAHNMLKLNKLFQEKPTNELEKEIKNLNDEIDLEVYALYGLSPDEIKLVENQV